MHNKIIRSICYFTKNPSDETVGRLSEVSDLLAKNDYEIQTKRVCASGASVKELDEKISDKYSESKIKKIKSKSSRNSKQYDNR